MMKKKLAGQFCGTVFHLSQQRPRAEWCEETLLENTQYAHAPNFKCKPADYELLKDLTAAELKVVQPLLQPRTFKRGQFIINAGDDAREMFFLTRGHVSVLLPGEDRHRLATFSPGMSFGEMAFLDGAPRSANIVADSEAECDLITMEDFQALGETHPAIKIKILANLSLNLTGKLRKANREMSVFE